MQDREGKARPWPARKGPEATTAPEGFLSSLTSEEGRQHPFYDGRAWRKYLHRNGSNIGIVDSETRSLRCRGWVASKQCRREYWFHVFGDWRMALPVSTTRSSRAAAHAQGDGRAKMFLFLCIWLSSQIYLKNRIATIGGEETCSDKALVRET